MIEVARHSPMATLRAIQAAERRRQREMQRQLRELERLVKQQAKLSAIEQARLPPGLRNEANHSFSR